MPKYEYEVVVVINTEEGQSTSDIERALNARGHKGFRFVGLRQGTSHAGKFHYPCAIMEREVPDGEEHPAEKEVVSTPLDDDDDDDDDPTSQRAAYEWDDDKKKPVPPGVRVTQT